MQGVPPQKGIVFFLLETVRGSRALLIACAHVARYGGAKRLRFGTFQRYNFLRHWLLLRLVWLNLFFFGLGRLLIGQTKQRGNGLPNARGFVLFLEL